MKLIKKVKKSYSQPAKIRAAILLALDYYGRSRAGNGNLWGSLFNDGPVGNRVFYAITDYVHGLSTRCGYCQDRIFHNKNSNVDHILPISKYPQFTFIEENMVRVCATCNMLKLDQDYFALAEPVGNGYRQHAGAWACFHPRHHTFSQHIEKLIVQTNHLHFRAYLGKTLEGKKLCTSLLHQVSEFEVKATANPVVAQAAQKLNQLIQSKGNAPSAAVKHLLQTLVANI